VTARTLALALFAFAPATAAAAERPAPPVQVRASVDRTAMWVADRVTYTVDIVCGRGVDILADDLAKEKLRLNGLEVVTSEATSTTDAAGETKHRFRFVLTTYRVDTPSPSIEPTSIRYYARRPGQRLEDVAPAGETQVPGAVIAFRSTLPESQPIVQLRDDRVPAARHPFFGHAEQAGVALIVLSLVPAAFVVGSAVARRARKTQRRSRRQVRQDERAALERLRALDVTTEEDRRRAYDEISAAVRAHLAARAHVAAPAMTAPELDAALASGAPQPSRESATALLAACDAARYGPPQALPPPQACRDALVQAEQLLGAR
jgi:hypothetical protein